MIGAETLPRTAQTQWPNALVWFTLAISCLVFIEPAPYDLMVILLFALLYALNLRVPGELGVALFLMALFTAGNVLGAFMSGDPDTTVRPLITRTYMVLSWLLFTSIIAANAGHVMKVLWSGYTFAALLAAVWGCLEYYGLLSGVLAGDAFGRAKGPFKDANVFGPFLVPVAIYTVSRMLRSRGLAVGIELAKFLIVGFGVLLSFSRGSWINIVTAFGLFMLFSIVTAPTMKEKLRLVVLVIFLSLAAGVTLTWAINNTAAGQRFVDRAILFKSYDVETGGRFYTQGQALQELGSNPVGIGPGMSTPVFGMEPHNLYLHTAIEGGWLAGVGFYFLVLLAMFRGLARVRARSDLQSDLHVALAVLIGTLFQSLFIDSTHWRHLWLLLAMVWGLTIAIDRQRNKNSGSIMYIAADMLHSSTGAKNSRAGLQ